MNTFEVCLHGPDLPRAGVRCAARFDDTVLVIDSQPQERVEVDAIAVSVGGFDDHALLLSWQAASGTCTAAVESIAARGSLLATAPQALRVRLTDATRKVNYHQFKWQAVLTSLGVIALLVILVLWNNERVTAWLADRVSVETEQRLGKSLLASFAPDEALLKEGPVAQTVARIGARLTKDSRYKYEWYVVEDQQVNAFALPGGKVIVNSGLIAATESAEELAGVLAHEVQHIELRHSLRQMIHTAGWAAVLTVVLGDVSVMTGMLVHQLGNLQYSRTLESEADVAGLQAMARAGIPPTGMRAFFARLQAIEDKKGGGLDVALLSSHPATGDRLKQIEQLAAQTPCSCQALDMDWTKLKADLKMLREQRRAARRGVSEPDGI